MKRVLAFLRRDIRHELSYRLSFALQIIGIFPIVLMFLFLSRLFGEAVAGPLKAYGGDYFSFVLIGIAVQSYLSTALNGFSRGLREAQISGTLEAMLVTPTPLRAFWLGSAAYDFFLNAVRVILYLLVGGLFFQARLAWSQFPAFLAVLVLTALAFSSLGLLSAAFIMVFKRGDPLNWAVNVASWLIGGVYYPLSVLPGWLRAVASALPITPALEALRLILLQGRPLADLTGQLAALVLWSGLGIPLGLWAFRAAVERARAKGTLGHY